MLIIQQSTACVHHCPVPGGGNVGDGSVHIPLPSWVLEAGEALEDEIFFTDKDSARVGAGMPHVHDAMS